MSPDEKSPVKKSCLRAKSPVPDCNTLAYHKGNKTRKPSKESMKVICHPDVIS